MSSEKPVGGHNPLNRKIVAFVAVAVVLVCVCLVATHSGDEFEAGKKVKFTLDDVKYEEVSSEDLTVKVTGCKGSPTQLTIPENVTHLGKTYSVITIGDSAFYGSEVKIIQLPNTLKTIEGYAF